VVVAVAVVAAAEVAVVVVVVAAAAVVAAVTVAVVVTAVAAVAVELPQHLLREEGKQLQLVSTVSLFQYCYLNCLMLQLLAHPQKQALESTHDMKDVYLLLVVTSLPRQECPNLLNQQQSTIRQKELQGLARN